MARKLTDAEEKRKEIFEEKMQCYEKKGYGMKDLTVSVVHANVMAFVLMIPIIVVMGIVYFCVNKVVPAQPMAMGWAFALCLIFLVFTVIHELIHGITWACFARRHWKAIQFGVIWEMLTPYCTCMDELRRNCYMIGAAMPTIILGVLPMLISIFTASQKLFLFSALMILAGGGDACIILTILRHKEDSEESFYIDHPYECGVVVFEK